MKIAVIGAGISGLASAYFLSQKHEVTLFEKRKRLGGHSATKTIDYDNTYLRVDTGFIVYNDLNYPNLVQLFKHLDVPTEASNMSFSFSASQNNKAGIFEWAGHSLNSVFAQRKNIFSLKFWHMLSEILRFNKLVRKMEIGKTPNHDQSLQDWLVSHRFSENFQSSYLLPMAAAIWSTPAHEILDFPAMRFMAFFKNHRLVDKDRPKWRTVRGGSQEYVKKIAAHLSDIRLDSHIEKVVRNDKGVSIYLSDDTHHDFDAVVFATHTNQCLALLDTPSPQEQEILSAVAYKPNKVYLHRDQNYMPQKRLTWAAWNYLSELPHQKKSELAVTYWMNKLQNLSDEMPVFVTLNPKQAPRKELTFGVYEYDHPQFNRAALIAQDNLPTIQGQQNTYFCGAWTGYGFHEDGLKSAIAIARAFEVALPWETQELKNKKLPQAAE